MDVEGCDADAQLGALKLESMEKLASLVPANTTENDLNAST